MAVHEPTSVGYRQITSTLRARARAVTSLHQFRGSYSSRSAPSRRLLQHAACFRSLETATPASTSGFRAELPARSLYLDARPRSLADERAPTRSLRGDAHRHSSPRPQKAPLIEETCGDMRFLSASAIRTQLNKKSILAYTQNTKCFRPDAHMQMRASSYGRLSVFHQRISKVLNCQLRKLLRRVVFGP